jgi:hypothetical protein
VIPCPHCNGSGFHQAISCGDAGCQPKQVPCFTCESAGEITEEHMARVEAGRKLREDRVARGLTLSQEAERLGVSRESLSKREWGKE